MSSAELAIVMPIYNEAANIETVIAEWLQELEKLKVTFEILAIDDGSTDRTAEILRNLAQRNPTSVIPIARSNGGHGQACRTGYSLAVARGSAWTFQIDSDGQCDPRFFADFWKARDESDCIFGVRRTRDDGISRVMVSAACRFLTLMASGKDLGDLNVPYRLMRTAALKTALLKIPDDFDMQNVALTLALKRDPELRWKYIPIHFRDRQGGTPSIDFKRMAGMGWGLLGNLHKIKR
jgi:glycosyltransferase involved in cell wall biosynthesis